MTQEVSQIICKICKQIKARILAGKFDDEKNKKWVDSTGKLFNGKVCPDCHRDNVKKQVKEKRTNNV